VTLRDVLFYLSLFLFPSLSLSLSLSLSCSLPLVLSLSLSLSLLLSIALSLSLSLYLYLSLSLSLSFTSSFSLSCVCISLVMLAEYAHSYLRSKAAAVKQATYFLSSSFRSHSCAILRSIHHALHYYNTYCTQKPKRTLAVIAARASTAGGQ
jgi:hypothetical protein